MDKFFYFLFFAVASCTVLPAQLTTDADFRRKVYEKENYGGLNFHSRGFGAQARLLSYQDGFNKVGWEMELTKIRHPKETLTPDRLLGNSRGFVFGRINTFFALRGGLAKEKILFDKTDQGSISITWVYSGGLSLGLLKPIYVQFIEPNENGINTSVVRRYNPSEMPASFVIGEASFFRGFDEMRFRPGLYFKTGFSFDFQLLDDQITALEVGVLHDYYVQPVRIFTPDLREGDVNKAGFLQIYFAFNFGKKKL